VSDAISTTSDDKDVVAHKYDRPRRIRLPLFSGKGSKDKDKGSSSDENEEIVAMVENGQQKSPPKVSSSMTCHVCACSLGIRRLKHHCKNCGKSVCASHSRNQLPLPHLGILRSERVCDKCAKDVLQQRVGLRRTSSNAFPENEGSLGGVLYSCRIEEQDDTMDNIAYVGSFRMTGRSLATRNLNSHMMIWKDRQLIITPAEAMCFKHGGDTALGEVRTTVHMTDILHIYIHEKYPRILTAVRADGRYKMTNRRKTFMMMKIQLFLYYFILRVSLEKSVIVSRGDVAVYLS
jgi:hypothetical protein